VIEQKYISCGLAGYAEEANTMTLTSDTYHSPQADAAYLSNSQWKRWLKCPMAEAAKQRGEWTEPPSMAMLAGTLVDRELLGGSIEELPAADQERLYTKKGELRADFREAQLLADRFRADPTFAAFRGAAQTHVILTGTIGGLPWRGELDLLLDDGSDPVLIADVKTTASFEDQWTHDPLTDRNVKVPWYDAWGYWRQAAIYRELWHQANPERPMPECMLFAGQKGEPFGLQRVLLTNETRLDGEMARIAELAERVQGYREGRDVWACGKCDYCLARSTFELAVVGENLRMYSE